jgi:argininosuccinate synthase
MDANLMHISYESGILERPDCEAPSDLYQFTSNPSEWPDEDDRIEIEFKKGILI